MPERPFPFPNPRLYFLQMILDPALVALPQRLRDRSRYSFADDMLINLCEGNYAPTAGGDESLIERCHLLASNRIERDIDDAVGDNQEDLARDARQNDVSGCVKISFIYGIEVTGKTLQDLTILGANKSFICPVWKLFSGFISQLDPAVRFRLRVWAVDADRGD